MTKFKLSDIQPNPFRHLERYPIKRDKIEALRKSYRETGFWDNVVARLVDGKPQIAYGHHRLHALREEYSPDHKIELIIRGLDEEYMLKMMANENMEEWGTSATVELETVAAVVEAYGTGLVELAQPGLRGQNVRYAPSFQFEDSAGGALNHPYTVTTIAGFLGWDEHKVRYILSAHQLIESDLLTRDDFDGLTSQQARAVVERANRAKADREAAARIAQEAAGRAKRDAEDAKRRQVEAEKKRKEQEAKAAKERDERRRHEAEEQARRAAEEAKRQEELRKMATKRQAAQEKREKEERRQAKDQATSEGRDASKKMKSGEEGYKQASKSKGGRVKTEKKQPDIEDYARSAATAVHEFLNRDELANGLNLLVDNKHYMSQSTRENLAKTLVGLASRATKLAGQLADDNNNIRADAEINRAAIVGR